MSLPKFSVRQPVFTNMLMILVFLAGFYYYSTLPREMLPLIPTNIITITTVYPGATPQEVENLITAPLEEDLSGVEGIDTMTSVSIEGASVINIQVRTDYKMEKVLQDVKSQVDTTRSKLPTDLEDDPVVKELKVEFPVCTVSVSGNISEKILRRYAKRIRDKLKTIPGVSSINFTGYRDREIRVEVDPDKLIQNKVSLTQVTAIIKRKNLNFPGGKLQTSGKEYLVRTLGEINSPQEINNIILRSFRGVPLVYVKDVAKVKDTFEERKTLGKVNGRFSINLDIEKRHTGDTLKIIKIIRKYVKQLQSTLPPSVHLSVINDMSFYIRDRIKLMKSNGLNGLFLVLLSLYLMLNFQMAIMTAIGIPFAFFGTFVLMKFFGVTINMISLFGMIVVLGMIVDDAIVICENFFRYMEMGFSPKEAAILGTEEVMWPVIAAVTTTVAAFLPLAMMTGMMGKFMATIPYVVIMALFCSLIEALIILPSHLADFVRPLKTHPDTDKKLRRWYDPFFDIYERTMVKILKYRYGVIVVLGIVSVLSIILALTMRFVLIGRVDSGIIRILMELPADYSLRDTNNRVSILEKQLRQKYGKYIKVLTTDIGSYRLRHKRELGENLASIKIELNQDKVKVAHLDTLKIMQQIKSNPKYNQGFTMFTVRQARGGPPVGDAISYKIKGPDLKTLKLLAEKVKKFLGKIPGVVELSDDFPEGKDEIIVNLDENKAKGLGIDVFTLAQNVRTVFNGAIASTIRRGDEEINIRVIVADKWKNKVESVGQIPLLTKSGEVVLLRDVANISIKKGYLKIRREDQERTVTVSGDVIYKKVTPMQVKKRLKNVLPKLFKGYGDYRVDFAGEVEDTKESLRSLFYSFIFAALLIYLILGTQFSSFIHPFTIMLTVPFGFIGVIFGFYITGKPLGLLALIGLVALSGIVVNDSLVLIDFIIRLREEEKDKPLKEIVAHASRLRVRPILLTSITTIFGLLPMCFATSGQASFLAPMAQALSWGLTFSTILTLIVIPCVYLIMEDLKHIFSSLYRKIIPQRS
jgi:multidrug efflux pump subunit AcrB